ncbi:MAG TPA: hypothetical protein H9878_03445 [Candidatus Dietzia merdigallinarum]|nr:hypothetical protein [Candidatus Dietzia merdigallinarum]
MRKTALASAATALAAATMLAGAGAAHADEPGPQTDLTKRAECILIETFRGVNRQACLDPAEAGQLGSIGYGSFGTGSLADLLTGAVNLGSVALSVAVPNSVGSTGFYLPGSTGSYGPEASIGELLTGSLGSLGGAF